LKQLIFVCWLLPFSILAQNTLLLTEEKQGIIAFYEQNPLDINLVGEAELSALGILDAIQIKAFINHRKQIGRFLSIYELQSIPSWEINTLRILQRFMVCRPIPKNWLSPEDPKHQILLRSERTLEQKKGFSEPTSRSKTRYLGNPWSQVFRYRGYVNPFFRGGLLIAKDAGEPNYLDFSSGFIEIKDPKGHYKWILGDFINQWGQGLVQSGSFSLGKSYESIRATQKFHGGGLPYTSSGEAEFYRGINFQRSNDHWLYQFYVSHRKKTSSYPRIAVIFAPFN